MPNTLSEQLPCLAVYHFPCHPCPTHSQNSCLAWKITFLANHAQHTLRTVALLGSLSHSLPTMPNTLSEQLPCLAVYHIPCQPCPTHSQNSCLAWKITFLANHAQHTLRTVALFGSLPHSLPTMPNTLSEQLPCLAVYHIPCQPCPTHSQNSCLVWQFTTFLANRAQHTLRTVALFGSLSHSLPTMPNTLSEQLPCLAVYHIPCQPCPTHSQNSCLVWQFTTFLAIHAQHTLRTVALLGS